jgi:NAD(P)-dependent dehydrogenase (short-subunit alcohol dehydrogenase family)
MDLRDAGVLVTGGASGLGAATARLAANSGARVVIADLQDESGAGLATEIGARYVRADVTDEHSLWSAVNAAAEAPRGLRLAVSCAGVIRSKRLLSRHGSPAPMSGIAAEVQVNLVGSINTLRLAAAAMFGNAAEEDGERGVVVLTSSLAAFDGQVGQVGYAAAKAGVAGLVLPAARDLAGLGIRVVAIAPGMFDTPMLSGDVPDAARLALLAQAQCPQRAGRPIEFARLVEHIASNPMLNAEVIRLDGGVRMPANL